MKKIITGTVVDKDNLPLPGVNVWLKNSTVGVTTDVDGKYIITIEDAGGVLVFSYLGMTTQEIAILNQKEINVTLSEDTEKIEEVVVVGYGRQKKESVVGAISKVDVA